jgi:protein arginine kinase
LDSPDRGNSNPGAGPGAIESAASRSLAAVPPAWLALAGKGNAEVTYSASSPAPELRPVLLTRAQLFRNFAGFPFVVSAPPGACGAIADKALELLSKRAGWSILRLADAPHREIRMLRERELLPLRARPFPGKKAFKFLAFAPDGSAWSLVNEVEHLTFGTLFPGCPAPDSLAAGLPDTGEAAPTAPWAWSRSFGHLTSDPARLGPGFAVETILHLPGLALSRQLPHARNYLASAGLGFLPVYAASPNASAPGASEAALFRASSRGGLGKTPRSAYEGFLAALKPVLKREMEARERCLGNHRKRLEERVRHSLQKLAVAPSLTFQELLAHGSLVRFGAVTELTDPRLETALEAARVKAAAGHLAVTAGRDLGQEEEDFSRSNVVRLCLRRSPGAVS